MKKFVVVAVLALMGMVGMVRADAYTYTVTVTNGQAISYSDALPVSGWLDRIEVTQDTLATTVVAVATYNSTTAIDTFFTKTMNETDAGKAIARTRVIGTANTCTALAAATLADTAAVTNGYTTTFLMAQYERPMLGGNLKVAVTGTCNDGSNPVKVTIYYEPVRK